MSKTNGNIIYKDGNAYLNGKLIGIGFEQGEHIPRASDYKLPKKLSKSRKEFIDISGKFFDAIRESYKNENKDKE